MINGFLVSDSGIIFTNSGSRPFASQKSVRRQEGEEERGEGERERKRERGNSVRKEGCEFSKRKSDVARA
jgi:hypothetical protein